MTRCIHTNCDDPNGLRCTRDEHADRGHVYHASAGADLDQPHHHTDGSEQ